MSTSSLPSFIKIHLAVLEKKSKMWKVYGWRKTTTTDGRTDDGRCAMTIAHSSLWLRWAKNVRPCWRTKNILISLGINTKWQTMKGIWLKGLKHLHIGIFFIVGVVPQGAAYIECVVPFYTNMCVRHSSFLGTGYVSCTQLFYCSLTAQISSPYW